MSKIFIPYHVVPRYSWYAVYKWTDETKTSAHKEKDTLTKDEARALAYRLNGEYLKSINNNKANLYDTRI